jgi:REP element-mobilizing transposase RayT
MARSLRLEYAGALHHVMIRGNARQRVFLDEVDHERFLRRLADSVATHGVRLYAFCLLGNHGHLVVETPRANLGRFMHGLTGGYAVYFNLRHRRVGHFAQGRYKSKLVEGDEYLDRLSRYVHLNPVRTRWWKNRPLAERLVQLRRYRWSSYPSYVGLAAALEFVSYGSVLARMGGRAGERRERYRQFVETGLAAGDAEFEELLATSARSIGGAGFGRWVEELHAGRLRERGRPEDVAFRRLGTPVAEERVLAAVLKEFGVARAELRQRRRESWVRPVTAKLLVERSGLTQREVAEQLGLGTGAAVSIQLRKLQHALGEDPKLRRLVARIEAALGEPAA